MKKHVSIILLFISFIGFGQLKTLKGIVIANDDVEGIHILNKSSVKYTVTDTDGSFQIPIKANDTLTISSLKYETIEIEITALLIAENNLKVYLKERVTQLDEVVVGRILTGSLSSDLDNLNLKAELNAKDLGIPGYYGKPKTISERKLSDADGGGWGSLSGGAFGGGVGLNVHKLLNRISGRTKKLKRRIAFDKKNKCREQIIKEFKEQLFTNEALTEAQQNDYFYFCMEDGIFTNICDINNFEVIEQFLIQKLEEYKSRLSSHKD